MTLEGRVAVISGATGGLGSLMSRELSRRGVRLALLDRDSDKLEKLGKSLSIPEDTLLCRTVDLLSSEETKSAADEILARFKKMDILLHLVGGWTGGRTIVEAAADDLTFNVNQHIRTTFHVLQAFVPHLIANGWGRIVMISSPTASRPAAKSGPYAAGKAGQEALLMALSQELKGTGVTANLLLARTIDIQREKISHPAPDNSTWSTPEELAAGILYLLTDEAGTINGAKIPLFGSYA